MARITLGQITSSPDADGKHGLRCPKCGIIFRSLVQKSEKTGELTPVTCERCKHSADPKHFIAAAQQATLSKMATDYMANEIKKILGESTTINLKL